MTKLYLCRLGERIRKIRATTPRNAEVIFKKGQRMYGQVIINEIKDGHN